MVDLPKVDTGIVTSRAPQSSVTGNDIRRSYNQAADAAGNVADVMMDVAKQGAKKEAADELMNQKVVRNADGSVSVENPVSSPLIFGDAGRVFSDAVKVGTIAQHSNSLSQDFAELHTKFPTDPAGFKAAAQAHLDKTAQTVTGPMGEAIQQQGSQLLTQHYNAITSTTASNDIDNQKKSITAQIEDQKGTMIALARQGGTDTPEFAQANQKLLASYDALATNPLFKMPVDQIELEKKNVQGLLQGEALVAHVDGTFNKKGKAEAQKVLQEGILQNPNLKESDRSRLYTQGLSRLAYLTGDAKATIDANRQITTQFETGLSKGTVKPEDPAVGQAIQRARDIGDTEGAQRITAAAAVAKQFRGISSLPDAIQGEVLGVPKGGGEPVNTSIPPEGRGLLKIIGQTESNNRYDVRYSGTGPRVFTDYGDHPRVAEAITSGPDVGKTSSAAGYYQFIGPTWDAQKAKLGLKDFSPASQDAAAWDLAQTTYKAKTGQDLLTVLRSGDKEAINGVLPVLSGQWSSLPGGRQPASQFRAPAANGGTGFTAEQVKQNPFLLSAYVRTLAEDPELRVQSAKQTATAIGKALDNGILPSPSAYAEVEQAAKLYPEKLGAVADEIRGRLQGQQIAQLPQPQQEQIKEQYRAAANGSDVHHMNVAAAALKQQQDSQKNMQDHPYQEAARRGWTPPPAEIDPAKPDGIVAAVAQRAQLSQRIGQLNQSPNPPLLDGDDMGRMQVALQGQAGPQVLTGLATALNPDDMKTLLGQKDFVGAVSGMMSSKDPARMTAAMAFVDQRWRQNAAEAEGQFGSAAITRLQAWQALKDSFAPQELAERLNLSDDPATAKSREVAKEAAEKEVKSISASDMAYKLGSGWPVIGQITGSTPGAPFDSIKGGELVADYKATYTALRAYGVDADRANDLAVKRLATTWGPSEAAGNQIMKNPPERLYPQLGGKSDWIADDLKSWVAGKVGPQFGINIKSNLPDAENALNLTPQEKALYERHLSNLMGPGGVDNAPTPENPQGSRSTLFQTTAEHDGKFYTIPTVFDGKILWDKNAADPAAAAIAKVEKIGWEKFPSYKSEAEAEARYQQMHSFMDKDTGAFLSARKSSGMSSLEMGIAGVVRDRNWQVQGLISDGQTQAEIANGKPPSYQVAIKRADGTLDIIPSRIAFDPADRIAAHTAKLQGRQDDMNAMREIQFQSGGAQP